jgi:hypothetical protein
VQDKGVEWVVEKRDGQHGGYYIATAADGVRVFDGVGEVLGHAEKLGVKVIGWRIE